MPGVAAVKRELWGGWWPALAFALSAALLAAALLGHIALPPAHPLHSFRFFDLKVYRRAATLVARGGPLYAARLSHGLGFTYPPFAVLLFMALRLLSLHGDETAVTLLNITLVVAVAQLALRLPRPGSAARAASPSQEAARRRAAAGWLAAAAALWAEPVSTAIGYGQIDVLVAVLVVADLALTGSRQNHQRDAAGRFGGVGIGLAAALKLTPLIFIPYLALTGRGRMAVRATATFAASILVGLAVLPGDSWSYWLERRFMDVTRVTGRHHLAGSGAANQSLHGALLRFFPQAAHQGELWLAGCLLVGAAGLLLAARACRRGDEAWGFMLTAVTGLLISPVSWTHHWTIAVAGVIALVGSRGGSILGGLRAILAVAFGLLASEIWLVIKLAPGQRLATGELLLGDLYVLAAFALIATAALMDLRHTMLVRAAAQSRLAAPAQRLPAAEGTPV